MSESLSPRLSCIPGTHIQCRLLTPTNSLLSSTQNVHPAHPSNKMAPQVHVSLWGGLYNHTIYFWKSFLTYQQALNCSCRLLQHHLITQKPMLTKLWQQQRSVCFTYKLYKCIYRNRQKFFYFLLFSQRTITQRKTASMLNWMIDSVI